MWDWIAQVVYAFAALVVVVETFRRLLNWLRQRREFSWKQIQRFSDRLIDAIHASEFRPDSIIGLGRGGAIVAGIVASRLREETHGVGNEPIPVQNLDRLYLMNERNEREKVVIVGLHNIDPEGQSILLLNADSYTGKTLRRAKQAIEQGRPKVVKTGSLIVFAKGQVGRLDYVPDFAGGYLPYRQRDKRLPWRRMAHAPFKNEVRQVRGTVVVLHGLVATGKTSVTDAVVKHLRICDLRAVYSDWHWFRFGLQERQEDPLVNQRHNEYMIDLCWSVIGSGRHAILDCTSRSRLFRAAIREEFEKWKGRVMFIRCHCPEKLSLDRISSRLHIGPREFGTKYEYERVKGAFENMDQQERESVNLIEIDTDALKCEIVHRCDDESEQAMKAICRAVEDGYFSVVRR